jgi:hypothetical protein
MSASAIHRSCKSLCRSRPFLTAAQHICPSQMPAASRAPSYSRLPQLPGTAVCLTRLPRPSLVPRPSHLPTNPPCDSCLTRQPAAAIHAVCHSDPRPSPSVVSHSCLPRPLVAAAGRHYLSRLTAATICCRYRFLSRLSVIAVCPRTSQSSLRPPCPAIRRSRGRQPSFPSVYRSRPAQQPVTLACHTHSWPPLPSVMVVQHRCPPRLSAAGASHGLSWPLTSLHPNL